MKMMKQIGLFMTLILFLSVFLTACGSSKTPTADSGGKLVFKIGHTLSPESHYQLTALEFARLIKEKSNGKIEIQVFPQSQLGGELQMAQALKTGTQDMMICSEPPLTTFVKEWGIFDLPFLFDSLDQANKVTQGQVGQKYIDMLQNQNMIGLSWIAAQERNVFTTKKPIKTLDDMKNLKLRVLQAPGYVNGYKTVGANPTPLAYNELYLALQQGVVDGADTSPDQFVMDKFTEVSKYYSFTHMNYLPAVLAISKASWNKLTPDQQKIFQEAGKAAGQFDIKTYKQQYDQGIQDMKTKGIQMTEIDPKPWIQATDAARADLLNSIPNGQALYKEIQDAKK